MTDVARFDPSGAELSDSVPDVYAKFVLLADYAALRAELRETQKVLVQTAEGAAVLRERIAELERTIARMVLQVGAGDTHDDAIRDAYDRAMLIGRAALQVSAVDIYGDVPSAGTGHE